MDFEEANRVLHEKVVVHRHFLRKIKNLSNESIYTSARVCRFCGHFCKQRKLHEHDPLCIYVASCKVPFTNGDLKRLVFNKKNVWFRQQMGTPTWRERFVMWLIDMLHAMNPKRTQLAMIAFLELNGLLVYAPESPAKPHRLT